MATRKKPHRRYRIWVYKNTASEWRWQFRGKNGEIIAAASEGFKARASAIANLDLVTGFGWSVKLYMPLKGGFSITFTDMHRTRSMFDAHLLVE